ncbi:hypothetical protein V7S43_014596 [Phytophthora oleae]|uniref:Crinkler effector protein N-terminal domain-containing protein n=1 Tax=Phytophthora oleae TaxID=2107226 RepID=A0ABD3F4P0_9STRA
MVKLFCAIVGEPAFPVEIDGGESSVGDLKNAIKKKKPNAMKYIDANELKLFLAKKGGAWVRSR